ncbi:hypothetical protein KNT64_gp047 [Pseudomonas phage PspYZU05]|uniref:Uncharacterized protein n=1 Tax=Pseudomonas phage PspYZU05 TaxID=1983556 RepID=A0A2U7NBQ1_9CAUD|nr:hypothetical protein KNT64_gp047 [Pseudomonas phage PspYZU05]ASD51999.1 hypothetical protein PspYZU05_47 [Pseudomonas phage PspYZU05]
MTVSEAMKRHLRAKTLRKARSLGASQMKPVKFPLNNQDLIDLLEKATNHENDMNINMNGLIVDKEPKSLQSKDIGLITSASGQARAKKLVEQTYGPMDICISYSKDGPENDPRRYSILGYSKDIDMLFVLTVYANHNLNDRHAFLLDDIKTYKVDFSGILFYCEHRPEPYSFQMSVDRDVLVWLKNIFGRKNSSLLEQ